jgi:16S rRNA processing protein RimM
VDETFTVLAAHVTGAHGVGGNVRLRLVGENSEATALSLSSRRAVRLVSSNGEQTRDLTLTSLRKQPGPKGLWVARFKEIKDRNAAEELPGSAVFIPESARAALPDGEYYVDQLIGLSVATDTGRDLGRVTEIIHSPANDVYETDKNVLIPAVAAFILEIDLTGGKILVRDMPGLGDEP